MALTDIETVKKVIQSDKVFVSEQLNNRLKLVLFNKAQLEFTNITEDSEKVKIIRVNAPHADSHNPITLNDQDPVDLDAQKIAWDSVVVASDLILTTVYVESDDYIIDYENGAVSRSSIGSTIPNGGTVYVWYIPFVVLTTGDDYNIDYNTGEINRRAGSSIPNNATVYVDYNHTETAPGDALLLELIEEMEAMIVPKLKGGFSVDSADKGLKAAATNYVLYAFCLAASLKELNIAGRNTSDDLARRWHDLADKYLALAKSMFSKYLSVSTQQLGGLIQNRFAENRKRTIQSPTITARLRRH